MRVCEEEEGGVRKIVRVNCTEQAGDSLFGEGGRDAALFFVF